MNADPVYDSSRVTTPVARQVHDPTALLAVRVKDVADTAAVSRLDRICLKDGTQVAIRLLKRADREALTDLYGRLGEHSRYRRFFASPARLPASWADALLDLAPERRFGLVAELPGEPGRIVGFADYTILPDRERAEVGLLVEDAWQQRGLGRALFEHLIAVGESRGLRLFVAFVHWDNVRVIQALGRSTTILDRRIEGGVLKLTFTRSGEV